MIPMPARTRLTLVQTAVAGIAGIAGIDSGTSTT